MVGKAFRIPTQISSGVEFRLTKANFLPLKSSNVSMSSRVFNAMLPIVFIGFLLF